MSAQRRTSRRGRMTTLDEVGTPRVVVIVARRLGWALLVGVIAMAFVPWQQTAMGHGRIIAFAPEDREQSIEAPVPGRVEQWHVVEGQRVAAGDVLVTLADNAPQLLDRLREQQTSAELEISATESGLRALEAQIESMVIARGLALEAADAQIRGAEQKVKAARNDLVAAESEKRLARQNLSRRKALRAQGLDSQRDLEKAQNDAAKASSAELRAQARVEEARADLLAKQAERAHKGSDADAKISKERSTLEKSRADLAKAQAKRAEVDVKVERQHSQVVVAPRDGIVLHIVKNQGGAQVKAGDRLATLVPETDVRAVELWVSGNDAPLVSPGREVRLQFEGWPAVQFSGWPSVAVGTFGGRVAFVDFAANVEGRFRVVIRPDADDAPWPDQQVLRQGARVNGWVLLNQVSLGFEMWRQLNGFPPSVPGGGTKASEKSASKNDKAEAK